MKEKKEEFLQLARKRFSQAKDAEKDNRDQAVDDLEFLSGEGQWDSDLKKEREGDGRPCLVINRLPGFVDQVTGDQRQNKPAIKVRPVDSKSDPELAETLTGLIRNIEVQSHADVAYDTAAQSAAECGIGAFRIVTQYADDDTFDQDIRIKRIANPFTIYWDPAAKEPDRSDAKYCFVTEVISRDEFKDTYPKASISSFSDADADLQNDWVWEEKVRIAEYWLKEPVTKTLYLLSDNSVTDTKPPDPPEELIAAVEQGLAPPEIIISVKRERKVKTHKITCYKISGTEILEEKEWAGKYIPIVPVWGKELNIQAKTIYRGVIRYAKDAQRMYNYWRSVIAERLALEPKAPWLVTEEMVGDYMDMWNTAHKKNWPFLLFKPDPMAPGMIPQRAAPPSLPAAMFQETAVLGDELKATTGIYDASLGQRSNETSGKAIMARQREGDTATFAYIDNMARALTYAGKILVDLIPKIYDTERVIRVTGVDDTEEFVELNKPVLDPITGSPVIDPVTGKPAVINDVTIGKYDVVVSVGPSYSTQRIEAADSMMQFMQAVPAAGQVMPDLVAESMDWPHADKISKRLRKALPPQLLEPEELQELQQGMPQPEPPPPDPMVEIQLAQEQTKLKGLEMDNLKKELEARKILLGMSPQAAGQLDGMDQETQDPYP